MADSSDSLLFLTKYVIQSLIFMWEDEKIEMDPSNVLEIEKLDDFEWNIRTILKLTIRVDTRRKLWILKHKRELRCKFELDKIGIDHDQEYYVTDLEKCFNNEFSVYFSDDDEALDAQMLEEDMKKNEDESYQGMDDIEHEDYFESENLFDVYLFEPKLLAASKRIFNHVMTKDILQNYIARLLTETDHPKVLMSPCENTTVYKELLIPGIESYKGLMYLDQYYGLYEVGAMIYYGLERLYILNINGELTAKEEDEWPESVFLVTATDGSLPGQGMVRKDGEKVFYMNIPEDQIQTRKFAEGKNADLGSEAKIVVTDDITINVEEADQGYIDQRNERVIMRRKDDNKYTETIIRTRMEENDCIQYITGENWDINAFTPNKTYQIIFDDPAKHEKYGKFKYRIAYAYHHITAESMSHMRSVHRIILKKCPSK